MGNCAIGGKTNWFITETSMNSILVFLLATKSQALEFEKSLLTPAAVETKGNIQSFFFNGNKAFTNCNFDIFLANVTCYHLIIG